MQNVCLRTEGNRHPGAPDEGLADPRKGNGQANRSNHWPKVPGELIAKLASRHCWDWSPVSASQCNTRIALQCSQSFIPVFVKHLLSTCYVPGASQNGNAGQHNELFDARSPGSWGSLEKESLP